MAKTTSELIRFLIPRSGNRRTRSSRSPRPRFENSILGNGILPSGGDTKYILIGHVIGSYGIGVPAAIFSGFILHLSVWGVFGSRALEEVLKTIFFLLRYRTPAWYKKSVAELSTAAAK